MFWVKVTVDNYSSISHGRPFLTYFTAYMYTKAVESAVCSYCAVMLEYN